MVCKMCIIVKATFMRQQGVKQPSSEGHPTTYFSNSCEINYKQHYNNEEQSNRF